MSFGVTDHVLEHFDQLVLLETRALELIGRDMLHFFVEVGVLGVPRYSEPTLML